MRLVITGQVAREAIINRIRLADIGLEVLIREPKRNEEQSRKFHALCGDVAKQKPYMGKLRSKDAWKVLFISGHAIAEGLGADVVPGLEGEFCNIRESSADMRGKRMSSLIEYVLAYCADNEVEVS